MAGGMDLGQGGKGGKKPLDTAINLVPFIDLMAVTISFLLMTAVWTQIGRLQVSQSGGPTAEQEQKPDEMPPVNLLITDKALKLTMGGTVFDEITFERSEKGKLKLEKLFQHFEKIHAQYPEQGAITLQTEDGVRYEDLVTIIDECVGHNFKGVAVSPASG